MSPLDLALAGAGRTYAALHRRGRWLPAVVVVGLVLLSLIPVLIVGSTKQPNDVSLKDLESENLPAGAVLVPARGRPARGAGREPVHLHAPRPRRRLAGRDRRGRRAAADRARRGHRPPGRPVAARARSCRSRPTSRPSPSATTRGCCSPSRPSSPIAIVIGRVARLPGHAPRRRAPPRSSTSSTRASG